MQVFPGLVVIYDFPRVILYFMLDCVHLLQRASLKKTLFMIMNTGLRIITLLLLGLRSHAGEIFLTYIIFNAVFYENIFRA